MGAPQLMELGTGRTARWQAARRVGLELPIGGPLGAAAVDRRSGSAGGRRIRREVDRRWGSRRRAAGHDAAGRIGPWRGRQQRPRVRMQRGGEQLGGRGDLDDPPEVHHRHAVGEVLDDRQVVGDEDHRQSVVVAQRGEEVEDLRLHRHVERRDRLVGDEQPRPWRQRRGDADPLALTARQRVRAPVGEAGADPDLGEHFGRRGRRVPRRVPMRSASSASRTLRRTVQRGSSEPNESWKTGCTVRRRRGSSGSNGWPSSTIEPAVGAVRPRMHRPSVVLPEPDSPTMPRISPGADVEVDLVDGVERPPPLSVDAELLGRRRAARPTASLRHSDASGGEPAGHVVVGVERRRRWSLLAARPGVRRSGAEPASRAARR